MCLDKEKEKKKEMQMNLQPQGVNDVVFEGEGGGYYTWSTSKSPILGEAKVGAGKLVLHPRGFALPHYADSPKIAYFIRGILTVGMILGDTLSPNSLKENVLSIKEGDILPIPLGAVSWWFNGGDTDAVVLFLGETTKAYSPGQITYFPLTGGLGFLNGFSTPLISKVYNLTKEQSNSLVKSQAGVFIIKLGDEITMPKPNNQADDKLVVNVGDGSGEVEKVKDAGTMYSFTASNFPLLGKVGLSAIHEKLEANAISGPRFSGDLSVEVVYVVRGGGRVEIVGIYGESVLDSELKEGQLFVVPRLFVSSKVANAEGMEVINVLTSSEPVIESLAGNKSVWKAMSSSVLQASLGVTPEFEQLFNSNIENSNILVPPKST